MAVDRPTMAGGSTTVLVVEDNDLLRDLLGRTLARLDRRVLVAADADSALALFDHHDARVDLVIADVRLPGMNGPALAAELRRRDPDVGVLLVSGGFDSGPGAFPELDKPFTLEALEQRISEVLAEARGGPPARIRRGF
ncbi:MAG: response regulator [Gaiellaceae bacterium]